MLELDDKFFEKEIRSGYEVSATMKRAWAVQMTVLDVVLELADKHRIRLFMDYGSLLATVRHHGYIPWDDDIDMCVLRDDYMEFLQILKSELPDYMKVYSFYTTPNYYSPKGFIANRKILDLGVSDAEAEITKRYYGCPFATGIDFYPLDYVPLDGNDRENVKNLYSAAYDLAFNFETYAAIGQLEEYLPQLEALAGVKVKRDENIRTNIWKLADRIAMMTKRRDSRHVLWYPDDVSSTRDMRRKLSWYGKQVMMPFEVMQVPVPEGYDGVLRVRFGDNYMVPQKEAGAHEYPFFAPQQRKILNYHLGRKLVELY